MMRGLFPISLLLITKRKYKFQVENLQESTYPQNANYVGIFTELQTTKSEYTEKDDLSVL